MRLESRLPNTPQRENFAIATLSVLLAMSSLVPSLDAKPMAGSDANGQPQATFGFQTQTAAVPEPGTLTLLAIGAGALISLRRRRASN